MNTTFLVDLVSDPFLFEDLGDVVKELARCSPALRAVVIVARECLRAFLECLVDNRYKAERSIGASRICFSKYCPRTPSLAVKRDARNSDFRP